MSHQEVHEYFAQLPEWMKNDIQREIQLARLSSTVAGIKALTDLGISAGGGNLLAALGLVAYSEALGQLRIWNRSHNYGKTPDECFLAFFDEMNRGRYQQWRETWERERETTLYEALRCGLVHEYRPKVDAKFWIGDGHDLGLAQEDGFLIFKVEPYFRHFTAEADRLHEELNSIEDPQVPPPLIKPFKGRTPTPPSASSPPNTPITQPTS